MWHTIWLLVVKNWKTTAIGLATVIVWVANNLFHFELTPEQIVAIQTILISIGFFLAKDGNKTGL